MLSAQSVNFLVVRAKRLKLLLDIEIQIGALFTSVAGICLNSDLLADNDALLPQNVAVNTVQVLAQLQT